ncbi:hypothetical protein CONPUDRAFT_83201 [Coniophora puteana RWD-64-598 SS2]|uniref:Uncharacterized protein n=1 Tax=Coniophora puteana (strain RWD-64-598) TaxID=741705 RepID=A0A5M3MMJ5_CONPW|nr:uncharacterized protein CONPUDRAFT_83201 [Coniophora puteana RWD-64-598 SS2]EIW80004.1 hypothetical protein CONPUDRAFT_83201 [Coniophora puteana RWD-64-598 SS2]
MSGAIHGAFNIAVPSYHASVKVAVEPSRSVGEVRVLMRALRFKKFCLSDRLSRSNGTFPISDLFSLFRTSPLTGLDKLPSARVG